MLGKMIGRVNEWRTKRNYERLVRENPELKAEMESLRIKAEASPERGSKVTATFRSSRVVQMLAAEAAVFLEGCDNYLEVSAIGPYGTAVRITFQKADGLSPAMRADEAVAILNESKRLRELAVAVGEAFTRGDEFMFSQATRLQALVGECKEYAVVSAKNNAERQRRREADKAVDSILAQLERK